MPAFYNGRQLGQGEFAVVLDGITVVGRASSFNVSRVAYEAFSRVEFNGVVYDRERAPDTALDAHLDSFLDRPAPAPVEPEVPQPQLHVQYVDYNNLPVRGREDCLYVISPHAALGAGVELPCAYVYRPTAYDASPGTLNTLPYQPTNILARAVRASYAQGELFPRPRLDAGDGLQLIHRVAGNNPTTTLGLLLSNAHVFVEREMLCLVSGPTLAALPGHLVLPSASSAASSISVLRVNPQTARDIMTWGWDQPVASTTFVEELPPQLSLARPTDVAAPEMAIVREQYPITFVPGAARGLADRMMTEVNDAIASEADRQFTAVVDAALNTQTDPEVVADLVDGIAAAEALVTRTIIVRHVSHHDLLPAVGSTNVLYCVFGYPMAFVYRVNERSRSSMSQWVTTGYFPTNISAAEIAPMFNDGAGLLCELNNTEQAIGSHAVLVRIAVATESTRSVGFQTNRLNVLTHGPSAIWTDGPWFHRRTTLAPGGRGPNRNGDDFTNAVGTFDRISLPRIPSPLQAGGVFQRVFPPVRLTSPAPDLLNLDEPALAAPASSPPPAPNRRRLILD